MLQNQAMPKSACDIPQLASVHALAEPPLKCSEPPTLPHVELPQCQLCRRDQFSDECVVATSQRLEPGTRVLAEALTSFGCKVLASWPPYPDYPLLNKPD